MSPSPVSVIRSDKSFLSIILPVATQLETLPSDSVDICKKVFRTSNIDQKIAQYVRCSIYYKDFKYVDEQPHSSNKFPTHSFNMLLIPRENKNVGSSWKNT